MAVRHPCKERRPDDERREAKPASGAIHSQEITLSSEIDILADYVRSETGHAGPLDPDEDLLEAGILDSFNIVSLAMFAQEHFKLEFDGEDMVRDNLARLSSLAALIRMRRAAAP